MQPVSGVRATEQARPSARRILVVFPRYARSFGTFDHAFPLVGVKAFMPPQGPLVLAAFLPPEWEVRFADENVHEVPAADLEWADAVLLSGMHVQRPQIEDLTRRAHLFDKLVVLGGPSVSASPELYPQVDVLHVGELGDATARLIDRIRVDVTRPRTQEVYRTDERLPLERFPTPAYDLVDVSDYLLTSVQASSGCPFQCEFCDIPALYGRRPRVKTPQQVTAELDAIISAGRPGTIYFVDDNFIANPQAAERLLTELVRWQEQHDYPVSFACEATMNIVQRPALLRLMRDASFAEVFVGVETPDLEALAQMHKRQNLRTPLVEAVETLNSYGIEVVAGIIMGLDTDDACSGRRVLDFIAASQIPMLTINLLHALPRTPLWDRLTAAGRLVPDPGDRESNVEFLLPYDQVVDSWVRTVTAAFTPDALYARFAHQLVATYAHRRPRPARAPSAAELRRGLTVLARIGWHIGVLGSYRRQFWAMAIPLLRQGRIEKVIHIATVSHHLITFAGEVAQGTAEKCFYNPHGGPELSGGSAGSVSVTR